MPGLTRRQFLRSSGAIAAAGALGHSCSSGGRRRPNILYVMTDDQTVNEMSCYGNTILKTPNMDRLANEGFRFENCFVTNSLCAPSRATVLSGAYSHIHGIRGNSEKRDAIERMDPTLPTYPQLLQQAGYRTAMIGKWHLPHDPVGFDYWNILPGQGVYFDPDFIENGERKKIPGYATDITTDIALDFLRKTGDQPFCLVYQHKAPHRPFTPAPRHAKMFDDVELPYPETFDDDFTTRKVAREAEDMRLDISLAPDYKDLPPNLSPAERKRWIYQRFVKDRYRSIYGVDENLGRVLEYLDQNKLADDTLIIYTSDNGFFLGEYGWYDKRFMYEPSLRIPLVIRYPRLGKPGRVIPQMAVNIDFAPTMLDFAGVEIPSTMQGRSLRPVLEGNVPADWRKSVYYAYYDNSWALHGLGKEAQADPSFEYLTPHRVGPHRGVRTDRYTLIHYYGDDYWELFDLQNDPHQLRNVYSDPGYVAVVPELKQELQRLREQFNDLA